MARTILGSIRERYFAAGLSGSASYWMGQAPEGTALPLCVVVHQGEIPQWSSETSYLAKASVQFQVYGKGAAAVEDIAQAIMDAFDWTSGMTLVNGSITHAERKRYQLEAEGIRAGDDEIVYRAEIDYEFWGNRSYTAS